jgi:imidazolonepropionase-like amidohydrolase
MKRGIPLFPVPLTALLAAAIAPAQDVLVRGKTVVVAPDTVLDGGALLVRQGKVAWVGNDIPADARARATVADYGDATIVPGFVLPPTTLGRDRDLAEGALAFTPDLRAAEAFDPWQDELQRLPAAAVTSLVLAPSPRNVAGGLAALVKPGKQAGRVVAPELPVVLSLAQAARTPERPPTSLMGAIDLLRTAFTAAKDGTQAGPDVAVLRQTLQGSRRVIVHADTFVELVGALDLAKEFGFEPLLVGARDAEKVLPRLVAQKAAVVLDTLRADQRQALLRLPARLAEAGVPFCFGGKPDAVRLSAVLAVRFGLDRKLALQALTRTPAVLVDQADEVGSLRQGTAADFTVWTGDPLDLSSALVATWIDGVRVHGDAPRPAAVPSSVPTTAPGTAANAAAAGETR